MYISYGEKTIQPAEYLIGSSNAEEEHNLSWCDWYSGREKSSMA